MKRLPRLFALALACAAGGGAFAQDRNRDFTPGFGVRKAPPVVRAKPCEEQGQGFRAVPGSTSCVRVFGGVRTEVSNGRALR